MRLLFVADGRSPTARNWIEHFTAGGDEVHLVSTFPGPVDLPLASCQTLPVAGSGLHDAAGEGSRSPSHNFRRRLLKLAGARLRTTVRQWIGPWTLQSSARRLSEIVRTVQPDLVHALRIPYEGMLAALALESHPGLPLLVSVWGNDFTLHAPATPWMSALTRRCLRRADGLLADCRRDVRLAHDWGLAEGKPTIVLPGSGGVRMDVFSPPAEPAQTDPPTIINPRGFRAYVRNDTFFKSIPYVLAELPAARFVCPSMQDEPQARRWVQDLGLSAAVRLLPAQTRPQMADWFRAAAVAVSPTTHDGTPNTLLEAMACGCFPVAGDLESIREWITPEVNGFLVDPGDPAALAQAVLAALRSPDLRAEALKINTRLIQERAEFGRVDALAKSFYQRVSTA